MSWGGEGELGEDWRWRDGVLRRRGKLRIRGERFQVFFMREMIRRWGFGLEKGDVRGGGE